MILDTIKQQTILNSSDDSRFRTVQSINDESSFLVSFYTPSIISLKFKGIILLGLMKNKPNNLKITFFRWYTKCKRQKYQQSINLFVMQRGHKLTKQAMLYRLKIYAKNKKQDVTNTVNILKPRISLECNLLQSELLKQSSQNHIRKVSKLKKPSRFKQLFTDMQQQQDEKSEVKINRTSHAIASLRYIIDEKVLKKSIQLKSQFYNDFAKQSIREIQEMKSEIIQNNIHTLKTKKSLKFFDTISLVRQVSILYFQQICQNTIKKYKITGFTKIFYFKPNSCSLAHLQRQLELIEENIEKDEEIQQLTKQITERIEQLQNISDELYQLQNNSLQCGRQKLLSRLQQIFHRRLRLYFKFLRKIDSDSIIACESHFFGDSINLNNGSDTIISNNYDCLGLNSIKQIMEQQNKFK